MVRERHTEWIQQRATRTSYRSVLKCVRIGCIYCNLSLSLWLSTTTAKKNSIKNVQFDRQRTSMSECVSANVSFESVFYFRRCCIRGKERTKEEDTLCREIVAAHKSTLDISFHVRRHIHTHSHTTFVCIRQIEINKFKFIIVFMFCVECE